MKTIVIDVGHGWVKRGQAVLYDPGAVGRLGKQVYHEHTIAFQYAQSLTFLLKSLAPHWKIHLLHAVKENPLTLTKRRNYLPNADAFLSIHLNSSSNQEARGHEVWYYRESHRKLAECVYEAGTKTLEIPMRGIKRKPFAVLKRLKPAVLVELGFISNESDLAYLLTTSVRRAWAQSVAQALINYLQED